VNGSEIDTEDEIEAAKMVSDLRKAKNYKKTGFHTVGA
jgi:hypothetical protein